MAIIFDDTFDRADNATVGTADVGGTWIESPQSNGASSISSNTLLQNITGSGADVNIYQTASSAKPGYIYAKFKVSTGNVAMLAYNGQTSAIPFFFGLSTAASPAVNINGTTYGTKSINTWVEFEVKNINWASHTADFYVDGVFLLTGWNVVTGSIGEWRLNSGSTGSGIANCDRFVAADTEADVFPMTLTTKLKALYQFTGNANDSSGNGHDLTVTGATLTTDKNSISNQAYVFASNSDYLLSSYSFTNAVKSFSGWVYYTGTTGGYLWCQNTGTSQMYMTSDEQVVFIYSGSNYIISTAAIPNSTWTHITVTTNGVDTKMYFNGVLQTHTTSGSGDTAPSLFVGTNTLYVGRYYTALGYFQGKLDEFRFYDRELSHAEIIELYEGYDAPVEPDLTTCCKAYWKMDETSGNPADSSGNGKTLTQTGTVGTTTGILTNARGTYSTANYFKNTTFSEAYNVDLSLSAWIKFSSTEPTGQDIVGFYNGTGSILKLLCFQTSKFKFGVWKFGSTATFSESGTITIDTNKWYHLVGTFNAATNIMILYVDGVAFAANTYVDGSATAATNFSVNANDIVANDGRSYIDEIGIWSRVLTSAEVTELYNSGDGVTYPFSTGSTLNNGFNEFGGL